MLSSFDRPRYVKTAEKEEEPPKAVTDEEVPAASEHREEASILAFTRGLTGTRSNFGLKI